MSIVLLTGDHPRHAFLAASVAKSGLLAGLVIEQREQFVPEPPDGLGDRTRELFLAHFAGRSESEARLFPAEPEAELASVPRLDVGRDELNGPRVREFVGRLAPELLLSYGVHKLDEATLACAPGDRWNIHGGLSPWYRGAITLFWPSYLLEPQMTGMTVHELTQAIDGGRVVHQTAAPLVRGDGIHDLACRAVRALGEELPALVSARAHGGLESPVEQRTSGRIWRSKDWRPEHLHVVYDVYGNRIVDRYLDGEFAERKPKLVRQPLTVTRKLRAFAPVRSSNSTPQ